MLSIHATIPALVLAVGAAAFAGADYDLDWRTIDCGGGASSGGTFELSGTIGQPDAGAHAGGTLTLTGGFWRAGAHVPACPEDLDGSGDVGFNDLVAVLAAWGPCEGACPEDIDGSGDVGFNDLVAVLAAWGACA
jgi:hypothetical protein